MEIIKSADQAKPDVWVCAYNGLTCDCNDQLRSCHCNDSINCGNKFCVIVNL